MKRDLELKAKEMSLFESKKSELDGELENKGIERNLRELRESNVRGKAQII